MWYIIRESYRQGTGRLVSIENEDRAYKSLKDAQRQMEKYAHGTGDVVMYDPDNMRFVVVNAPYGWNYRYLIKEESEMHNGF